MEVAKPHKFIRFGAMHVTKPHKFIRFGDIYVTKLHKFIRFGVMEVTKGREGGRQDLRTGGPKGDRRNQTGRHPP